MKEFVQTWSKKLHPRKKTLASFAAILCMMALVPMTARAQTIVNVVGQQVNITQYSTLYVGEVLLDGQQSFYYLYSEDITQSTTVLGAVKDCLSNFENGQYSYDLVPSLVGATGDVGIATCSNTDYEPIMNSSWINAVNAAQACLPDETVISSSSENLFGTNPDFAAACNNDYVGIEIVDNTTGQPVEISGILGVLSTINTDNVTYQAINGQLVKVINRFITYYCESITTIYTRAELRSLILETPLTFEAIGNGTITVNLDDGATLEAIQYKLNDAEWTNVTWNTPISLDAHDVIKFRGDNGTCNEGDDTWAGFHFECSNRCYVYGNMMSLIDKDDFVTNTTLTEPYTFFHLFQTSDYEPNTTILNHPTKDIVLPATTLTANCYDGLFDGCQGMTRAPELPATTLVDWCYCMMFAGTGITTAPTLPATTLAEACYSDMFMNCTNLTASPDLPAATLAVGCYSSMFAGCTSLNYVKCLATDISANYCTSNWLGDVALTGTFFKAADMNDWPVGPDAYDNVDGIPAGWTVKEDMYSMPLTIETIEANTQLSLSNPENCAPFEYSYDGIIWIECAANTTPETTISVAGTKVYFRGNNTKRVHIDTDKPCYVYGNAMSMVTKTDFFSCTKIIQEYAFYNMFLNGKIMNHPTRELVLPAKKLSACCYSGMFKNCTNLTTAPELPATTLKNYCYNGMFQGCTGLTTAPDLPATKLGEGCYYSMFYGCTGLTTAPELPSTALENTCYYWMFLGCTNLESAPKLPATTLKDGCYFGMFINCTSLTAAPELPATSLVNSCYWGMFNGCTSLNYVKCLATDLGSGSTDYWLADVAATGTFVKAAGMTGWTTGEDGIPEGWNVENIDVFTTDGNWNVAANWSGNAVPAAGSNVAIVANAIVPSNYTANADNIDIYGSLTIADGGQLYHSNAIHGTIQKFIEGYGPENANTNLGYYLLKSPVPGMLSLTEAIDVGMVNGTDDIPDFGGIDLYYFDQRKPGEEWQNVKTNSDFASIGILANIGYLYANENDVTLNFATYADHLFPATTTDAEELARRYTTTTSPFIGWELIGNPFTCDAYLASGRDFYRMNATRDAIVLATDNVIKPCEGIFVVVSENDSETWQALPGIATLAKIHFTTTEPAPDQSRGKLDLKVSRDNKLADVARVRFGDGESIGKMVLSDNATRLSINKDDKDYSVVHSNTQGEQPISFKAAENGSYTLSVNLENAEMSYLHLIDNLTGADVDLLTEPSYTFDAKTTDYASRFRLVFSTDDENGASTGSATFAFISNGNIVITGDVEGATLQVIDVMGRVIVSRDAARHVSTNGMTPGVYVLRLINGDDVKTQKIVVR